MKFKIMIMLAIGAMTFAACNSEQKGYDGDSVLADSSMADSVGATGTQPGVADTTSQDTIPPIR